MPNLISNIATCPFCNKYLSSCHNEHYGENYVKFCMNKGCAISIDICEAHIALMDYKRYSGIRKYPEISIFKNIYCIVLFNINKQHRLIEHHNLDLNNPTSIISIYNKYKKLSLLQ